MESPIYLGWVRWLVVIQLLIYPCVAQEIFLEQRHLTAPQQEKITAELRKLSGKELRIVCVQSEPETCTYASDFAEVFKNAGWKLRGANVAVGVSRMPFSGLPTGVILFVSSKDASAKTIPIAARFVLKTLRSNEVPVELKSLSEVDSGKFELRIYFQSTHYYDNRSR